MACPSFITVLIAMFDTVCVVFLVLNVNDFAEGNSFYDTNITEANMEPFPRRETLPKPNYIVLSNISQPLRASARTGGTSQIVVHRLKEHSPMLHFFFLFLWGFINLKEGKFIWTIISFVVVRHFPKVSNPPSAAFYFIFLFFHVIYWTDISRHSCS